MGFAEDFTHVILNMKQELILLRTSSNVNALFSSTDAAANADIELTKISWMIPFVYVNNEVRIRLLDIIRKDLPLFLPFRSWEPVSYTHLDVYKRQNMNNTQQ